MLVGIVGTLCAGKHVTAEYLVQHHGFLRLHLPSRLTIFSPGSVDSDRLLPSVTDQKGTRGLTFPDVEALLEFVTKRWREHWVLTDIGDEDTLESLLRRPFFMLLSVDAPVGARFRRFNRRCRRRDLPQVDMTYFVALNDALMYGSRYPIESPSTSISTSSPPPQLPHSMPKPSTGTAQLTSHAHLQILNQHPDVSSYHKFLSTLDIPNQSRLRPPWDAYFMHLAHLASLRSNCMKRRVGCVLIHNNRIISTGYNGTPRGLPNCSEGGCPRCNSGPGAGAGLSTCLCLHAEENALLEAGRERIRDGAVLYCDTCPCLTCSVKIAQVGVKEVVYSQSYNMDEHSRRVLNEAGVVLRQFSVPKTGMVGFDDNGDGMARLPDVSGQEIIGQEIVVRNGR